VYTLEIQDMRYIINWSLSYGAIAVLMVIMAIPAAYGSPGDAANGLDAQCLVIGARISASPDQQQRVSGQLLTVYFLGRIEGRSPSINLEKLIEQQAAVMTRYDERRALQRCGKEFASQGAELVRIGRILVTPTK
jgi:hypothetical protein